jgi:hypothetical protein
MGLHNLNHNEDYKREWTGLFYLDMRFRHYSQLFNTGQMDASFYDRLNLTSTTRIIITNVAKT